jgi:hypothetical protein
MPRAYPTLFMMLSKATKANTTIKHRERKTSREAHKNQSQRTRAANNEKKEDGFSRGHDGDCRGGPVGQGPFVCRRSSVHKEVYSLVLRAFCLDSFG